MAIENNKNIFFFELLPLFFAPLYRKTLGQYYLYALSLIFLFSLLNSLQADFSISVPSHCFSGTHPFFFIVPQLKVASLSFLKHKLPLWPQGIFTAILST